MNKILISFFLLIGFTSKAQFNKYIVQFKDKNGSSFSLNTPSGYLSQRAINRRIRYQIPIDSTDLPVIPRYIDSVRLSGNVSVLNTSKWLNQISIETTDMAALAHIQQLPFVQSFAPIAAKSTLNIGIPLPDPIDSTTLLIPLQKTTGADFQYGRSGAQIRIHQGDFLHRHGFDGQGMQLAVMDAGFLNYNTLPTFDSIRNNGQVISTWDFVDHETSVAEDDSHGMHCLSTIAANMPGLFVGSAPKAGFYLYRTEDVSSEYPIEEHNFACAAERADSAGVDVCSVSLGYSTFSNSIFDYSYADMNGDKTISAKAADLAAKKGLLINVAAGNEGNNSWHYIITPADADSVIAVAAVDTLGNIASFSSYGPSSDGQIKPTLASVGRNAVVANSNTGLPYFGSGTSYACPNLAGLSTCLWQAFPEASNMKIMEALKKSSTDYDNPNDRKGYGIPDMKKAFVLLQKEFSIIQSSFFQCKALIDLSIKTDSSMYIQLERKFPGAINYSPIHEFHADAAYGMHAFHFEDQLGGTDYPAVNYQLRIKIGTDTTYLLDSMQVTYANPCGNFVPPSNQISIAPNPFQEQLEIKFSLATEQELNIKIYNDLGQKLYDVKTKKNSGTGSHIINTQRYSRGTYFIQITNGKQVLLNAKAIRI